MKSNARTKQITYVILPLDFTKINRRRFSSRSLIGDFYITDLSWFKNMEPVLKGKDSGWVYSLNNIEHYSKVYKSYDDCVAACERYYVKQISKNPFLRKI